MRLLPRDADLGWTRIAWLIYAVPFVAHPFLRGVPAHEGLVHGVAVAVFLVLYFRALWQRGPGVLPYTAGMLGLAVILTPINPYANAFFIYAAATLSHLDDARLAWRLLAGLVALTGAYAWAVALPPWVWGPAVVFEALIGSINIHFAAVWRANARLRRAHDEVAREAQEAERERIGRDLHDLLGHTLSVIVLKAELAAKLVPRDPARATEEIRDVERIGRDALSEVRAAVRGYRGGLQTEIGQARRALEAAGVAFECDAAPVPLQPSHDGVMALALREAVTNVLRHSGARTCRVRLTRSEEGARLVVEDDGRGAETPEGTGLLGMRERVEALGGRVEREAGAGTRLAVWLPSRELGIA